MNHPVRSARQEVSGIQERGSARSARRFASETPARWRSERSRASCGPRPSSPNANNPGNAWIVNFNDGNTNNNDTSNTNQVRCVR